MTTFRFILSAALALSGLVPIAAHAQDSSDYQTPEEVLFQQKLYGEVPRSARDTSALQQAQFEMTNTYKAMHAAAPDESAEEEESVPESIEEEEEEVLPAEEELSDPSGDVMVSLSPADLRLLLRLKRPTILESTAAVHESAPLAPSGFPEVATMIVILGTIAWTLKRAKAARG